MSDYPMTINGRPELGNATFDVVDPATAAPFAKAPICSPEQLDDAVRGAGEAWTRWRTDEGRRRAALRATADVLAGAADELSALLTLEQGKPTAEAIDEIADSQAWFRYYADVDDPAEVLQDDETAHVELRRRPLGVVAAIVPWNYPLTSSSWKLAPALRAGNTVVLKPSPYTPLATLRFGELLARVLPPGVVNVISGLDDLGPLLTAHPQVRKISFTGSTETGKRVAAAAATDLKRVTLELGGNDPAIILDDADPTAIAETLFSRAFENNGQVCSAVKRIYAPRSIYARVVDDLAAIAASRIVGPGSDPRTQLGPLNNQRQLDHVAALVDDARTRGGRIAAGGARIDRPGYFYAPTIVADVFDGTRLVDEEQFGPALPVIAYDDLDATLDLVNSSPFGLCGSVWGDADRAADIAAQLDCGTAWINEHLVQPPNQPFGGARWSGIGVENGVEGLHGFSQPQTFYRPR